MTSAQIRASTQVPSSARPAKPCVAILPSYMSLRNFIVSGTAAEVALRSDVVCVVPKSADEALLTRSDGISYRQLGTEAWAPALLHRLVPRLGYPGLAYRFNEQSGFAGHRSKTLLSRERRAREFLAGNFVEPSLGRPFPSSRTMLDILTRLYWWASPWRRSHFRDLLRSLAPASIFLDQVQSPLARQPILAAGQLGIPVVGNIGSWDQPTTKGPVPPGLAGYLVQSRYMADALVERHGIAGEAIMVTGWPQMDCYAEPASPGADARLRKAYEIAPDARVILFGLYSPRLGGHEPLVARELVAWMASQTSRPMHLLLRPHPKTRDAGSLRDVVAGSAKVSIVTEGLDDLRLLRDQIRLSAIVISSFGSIGLDATALGRPAIYVGVGNPLDWRSMEHLSSAVGTGAIPVATTITELQGWIERLIAEPFHLCRQMAALRALHLDPLDGGARARVAGAMLERAKQAARCA